MKKSLSFLLFLALSFASLFAQAPEEYSFIIRGEIEGLLPGDTLVFERRVLPGWETEPDFEVVVAEPDRFSYTGTQTHPLYLALTYKPASGVPYQSTRRWLPLLVEEGSTVTLTGTADYISYCRLQGSIYDDSALQAYLQLDDSLGKARADIMRLLDERRESRDTTGNKELVDRSNYFAANNDAAYKRRDAFQKAYFDKEPSSLYRLVNLIELAPGRPFAKVCEVFEGMDPEVKQGYFGQIMQEELERLARMQPGQPAPDFRLTTIDGQEITLQDFAGSYLLFYHWSLCPGSMSIDQRVQALYDKYNDRGFRVIGVTPDLDAIRSAAESFSPDFELMGMLLKPIVQGMLAHPWFDVEEKGDNKVLDADYDIQGYPYFILVSPDGKFVTRGYFDAFDKTREVLAEQYPDAE